MVRQWSTGWRHQICLILALTALLLSCARESNRELHADAGTPVAPNPVASSSVASAARPALPAIQVPEAAVRQCKQICDRSRELKCSHAGECEPNCVASAANTPCKEQFLAFYGCLSGQPLQNFRCEEDGVAAIREGFCDKEQAATAACMELKMQP